jgi:hypothetical protein
MTDAVGRISRLATPGLVGCLRQGVISSLLVRVLSPNAPRARGARSQSISLHLPRHGDLSYLERDLAAES